MYTNVALNSETEDNRRFMDRNFGKVSKKYRTSGFLQSKKYIKHYFCSIVVINKHCKLLWRLIVDRQRRLHLLKLITKPHLTNSCELRSNRRGKRGLSLDKMDSSNDRAKKPIRWEVYEAQFSPSVRDYAPNWCPLFVATEMYADPGSRTSPFAYSKSTASPPTQPAFRQLRSDIRGLKFVTLMSKSLKPPNWLALFLVSGDSDTSAQGPWTKQVTCLSTAYVSSPTCLGIVSTNFQSTAINKYS